MVIQENISGHSFVVLLVVDLKIVVLVVLLMFGLRHHLLAQDITVNQVMKVLHFHCILNFILIHYGMVKVVVVVRPIVVSVLLFLGSIGLLLTLLLIILR
uniref:Uncharacterized protein n=1 Tax=Amphimedon queenslandica TaxID=400682 RepID=A0A1X7UHF8_AMPQE